MGIAAETTSFSATNPGATFTAVTMATGDTNRVRTFNPTTPAKLIEATRQGVSAGSLRIASPALHDNVRGINLIAGQTPSVFPLPREIGQPLVSGDTLTISLTGGTGEVDGGTITIFYQDLAGIQARLHGWPDISGYIEHIKPLEIDVTGSGTAMAWSDTVITTTEDLLNADRSYAVLGYSTDTAAAAVGLKGQEIGNLHLAGCGTLLSEDTNDYFIDWAENYGLPIIPVISANNKGSIFASLAMVATSQSVKLQLILARLSTQFAG